MTNHETHPKMIALLENQHRDRVLLDSQLNMIAGLPESVQALDPRVQPEAQSVTFHVDEPAQAQAIAHAFEDYGLVPRVRRTNTDEYPPLTVAADRGMKTGPLNYGSLLLCAHSAGPWCFWWQTTRGLSVWIHFANPFKIRREIIGYCRTVRDARSNKVTKVEWVPGLLPFIGSRRTAAADAHRPPSFEFVLPGDWTPARVFGELAAS